MKEREKHRRDFDMDDWPTERTICSDGANLAMRVANARRTDDVAFHARGHHLPRMRQGPGVERLSDSWHTRDRREGVRLLEPCNWSRGKERRLHRARDCENRQIVTDKKRGVGLERLLTAGHINSWPKYQSDEIPTLRNSSNP
jgi:hypothetical protein